MAQFLCFSLISEPNWSTLNGLFQNELKCPHKVSGKSPEIYENQIYTVNSQRTDVTVALFGSNTQRSGTEPDSTLISDLLIVLL